MGLNLNQKINIKGQREQLLHLCTIAKKELLKAIKIFSTHIKNKNIVSSSSYQLAL